MGLPGSMWCSCVLAAKARLVNASHCRCHRCRAAPEDRSTVEQPRDASRPRCRSRHAMSTHSRLKSSPNVRHLPPDRGCSDSAKRRRTQAISTFRPTSRRVAASGSSAKHALQRIQGSRCASSSDFFSLAFSATNSRCCFGQTRPHRRASSTICQTTLRRNHAFQQISDTGIPAAACLSNPTFCSSRYALFLLSASLLMRGIHCLDPCTARRGQIASLRRFQLDQPVEPSQRASPQFPLSSRMPPSDGQFRRWALSQVI